MIGADLARAVIMLVLAAAPAGLPISLIIGLLFLNALLSPPFDSARSALLPRLLQGERYVTGITLNRTTGQITLIVGYAGGATLAAIDDSVALLFNAVTFGLSALLIALRVQERPPSLRPEQRTNLLSEAVDGYRVVFRSPVMRAVALVVYCGVCFGVIPEGLAVTWAAHLSHKPDPFAFGAIMIASAAGFVTGSALVTWLLAPVNLLLDVLCLPYRNRGVYALADLPGPYRDEVNALIAAAHRSDLVGKLQSKLGDRRRGMIFFKWYGKNVETSVDVPDFHRPYRYVRTIGVSVFNTRQSTGKHFGPLRVTLRMLYNVNDIASDDVYIQVGGHVHRWRADKLFIFDDTLQHQSCNQSDEVRYCLFVDILRPSLVPGLLSAILTAVRVAVARFNAAFYRHWTFIK